MPPPLRFHILDEHLLAGDADWWELYAEAFAPEEREPRAVILNGVRAGAALAVSAEHGGRAAGLAVVHLLRNPAAVFLVYLAVAPELRDQGAGSNLLQYALQAGSDALSSNPPCPWVCEVTIPGADAPEEQWVYHQRLLRFYGRHGGQVLAHPYVQPPVDGRTIVPMTLVYGPAPGDPHLGQHETEALIRAIYREKYGAVNGIPDAQLDECLRRVGMAVNGV